MLRAELFETGNIHLSQVQILTYSTGDNHTKKETINLTNNDGHFLSNITYQESCRALFGSPHPLDLKPLPQRKYSANNRLTMPLLPASMGLPI